MRIVNGSFATHSAKVNGAPSVVVAGGPVVEAVVGAAVTVGKGGTESWVVFEASDGSEA